jgi:hypothetical protein
MIRAFQRLLRDLKGGGWQRGYRKGFMAVEAEPNPKTLLEGIGYYFDWNAATKVLAELRGQMAFSVLIAKPSKSQPDW